MHVFSARKAIPGRIPPGPLPLAVSRSLQASPPAGALIVPDRANRLSTGGEARAPPAPPSPWSQEQFELGALNKDLQGLSKVLSSSPSGKETSVASASTVSWSSRRRATLVKCLMPSVSL